MKVIQLKGTPREQGHTHGEAFRKEIHELADIRNNLIFGYLKGIGKEELEEIALQHVEHLKQYPDLHEEFLGIAEASALPHADLAVLNNYTDLRDFAPPTDKDLHEEGGCSVFSLKHESKNLCGQTWDMHASAEPYMVHIDNPDGHYLTLTGCLALAGVNQQGVCVYINNMHCRETRVGLIWPALVRLMLLEKSAKGAVQTLKDHMPSSGHNYLICDPTESFNIETTGKRWAQTDELKTDGTIFHTNHFVSELKETEVLSRQSKTTFDREVYLKDFFENLDPANKTVKYLCKNLLSEVKDSPIAIPRPPERHGSMTCGGIIIDFESRTGETFKGLYDQNEIHSFQF